VVPISIPITPIRDAVDTHRTSTAFTTSRRAATFEVDRHVAETVKAQNRLNNRGRLPEDLRP
jgi:hypothetical protein